MNECLICYEQVGNIIFLECLHSMCKLCLANLQQKVCPFCRSAINETVLPGTITNMISSLDYRVYEQPLRVRFRRRLRIKMMSETMDAENNSIVVESPNSSPRTKSNKSKNKNFKRDRNSVKLRNQIYVV